jgi:hypothetical protein
MKLLFSALLIWGFYSCSSSSQAPTASTTQLARNVGRYRLVTDTLSMEERQWISKIEAEGGAGILMSTQVERQFEDSNPSPVVNRVIYDRAVLVEQGYNAMDLWFSGGPDGEFQLRYELDRGHMWIASGSVQDRGGHTVHILQSSSQTLEATWNQGCFIWKDGKPILDTIEQE